MMTVDYRRSYIRESVANAPGFKTEADISIPMLAPAFQQMSDVALMEVVNMWIEFLDLDRDIDNVSHALKVMDRVFDPDITTSASAIDAHSNFLKTIFGNMVMQLTSRPTVKYHQRKDLMRVVSQVMTCLQHLTQSRIAVALLACVHRETWTSALSVFDFMIWSDVDAQRCLDDTQKAIYRIYQYCYERRYMHIRDEVFAPLYANGKYVHYYTHLKSVESLVSDFAGAPPCCEDFYLLSKVASRLDKIVKVLSLSSHFCFPILRKQRRYHSFRNGVYDTVDDAFYTWEKSDDYEQVPETAISCCFHDMDFNYYPNNCRRGIRNGHSAFFPNATEADWQQFATYEKLPPRTDEEFGELPQDDFMNIPTPRMDRIIDWQWNHREQDTDNDKDEKDENEEEQDVSDVDDVENPLLVKRFFWANVGRLLHRLNSMERCQMMMFLVGAGATGKSTIQNTIMSFYDADDVGSVTPQTEEKFGLEAIYQALLLVLPVSAQLTPPSLTDSRYSEGLIRLLCV